MTRQVISANRLTDGLVVYLTADGGWSERIADAQIVDTERAGDAEAALATAADAADRQIVVEPYAIDIDERDGERRPTKYREFIRAKGPTVRRDLGKQAAPDATVR
jgi:hypothetical protein